MDEDEEFDFFHENSSEILAERERWDEIEKELREKDESGE